MAGYTATRTLNTPPVALSGSQRVGYALVNADGSAIDGYAWTDATATLVGGAADQTNSYACTVETPAYDAYRIRWSIYDSEAGVYQQLFEDAIAPFMAVKLDGAGNVYANDAADSQASAPSWYTAADISALQAAVSALTAALSSLSVTPAARGRFAEVSMAQGQTDIPVIGTDGAAIPAGAPVTFLLYDAGGNAVDAAGLGTASAAAASGGGTTWTWTWAAGGTDGLCGEYRAQFSAPLAADGAGVVRVHYTQPAIVVRVGVQG